MILKKRKIGNTNLEVSELGFGGAPIGGWPILVTEDDAYSTVKAAWDSGIRYFDTAPLYGSGMSEMRLGNFLSQKKRDEYVISTKVGRVIIDVENSTATEKFVGSPNNKDSKFDFSYDGAMKSFEDSLARLKIDRVDILHLHDPDNHPNHYDEAKKGAIKAMLKLRDEGVVKALDCFLLAGRYTLADQTSLETLMPICKKNNISLILGGVFNSGLLINPSPETYFDYSKLDDDWITNVKKSLVRIPKDFESSSYWLNKAYSLKTACENFDILLKEAAIKFPYFNKQVSSCILGMTTIEQVKENIKLYNSEISNDFWKYLYDNELINRNSSLPL